MAQGTVLCVSLAFILQNLYKKSSITYVLERIVYALTSVIPTQGELLSQLKESELHYKLGNHHTSTPLSPLSPFPSLPSKVNANCPVCRANIQAGGEEIEDVERGTAGL